MKESRYGKYFVSAFCIYNYRLFFIFFVCKPRNIHLKSVRTARTADLVLACFFGKPENVFTILATTVNVRFSVAYAIALKAEKSGDLFYESQKIRIFLAPFIKIL